MSRCGYSEDIDSWALVRWRGAVNAAIKGKRGQAFLKELLSALDAMPEKKLVKGDLVTPQGEVCAIGSVMVKRGVDASSLDIYDPDSIADTMGISQALVREIEYINDECHGWHDTTGEHRFKIVRGWVARQIIKQTEQTPCS